MNQSPHAPNDHTLTVAPGTFCISCRYDLMGLPAEANCPECSRAIRDSLRFSPGTSGLPIAFNAWCTACGYNLVGLPDNSKCPECGKSIAESLRGDLLLHASPDHVRTLRLGASLVWIGTLLSIPLYILYAFAFVRSFAGGPSTYSFFSWAAVFIAIEFARLAIALVTIGGWWQLCTLDPAYNAKQNASKSRLAIRILLGATLACKLLLFLFGLIGLYSRDLMWIISTIAAVVWFTRFFFEMSYIRWLAPRLASKQLARDAARLTWLAPVLLIIAILAAMVTMALGFLAMLIAAGLILAILIMYWTLLYSVRKHLLAVEATQRSASQR